MNIFNSKTNTIVIIAVLLSLQITNLSAAEDLTEKACLKFTGDQWFTAQNLQVNNGWCQWNGDSFRVQDGLVRTYMIVTFRDGLTPEYRKENLGKEIIGNSNTANGALQIGDERENSSDWSKLLEFPIGDYGITYQHGNKFHNYSTLVGAADFYFIIGECTVKVGGSEIMDKQEDPNKFDSFNYLKQITTEEAQEIAEKLKNEPLCQTGSRSSDPSPTPPAESVPEVEALVKKQPAPEDFPPAPIDWQKCFAECPMVTASKDCTITPDTRPSETQCLSDLLRESLACQNACVANVPERVCPADTPPVEFLETNFGNHPYFVSDPGLVDTLIPPGWDKDAANPTDEQIGANEKDYTYGELERPSLSLSRGDYVEKLIINGGVREMDFTQVFTDLNFPDLKDANDGTFADPANSNAQPGSEGANNSATSDSDTRKQKNITLGEGARVFSLKGDVDVLLPGEIEWRELKRDDLIPAGSRVFTGMNSDLLISFPKYGAVKVMAFSDFILDQNLVDESCKEGSRAPLLHHLDLRTGDVEVIVEPQWNYQGSLQVTTPSATNAVRGTHFWVSYDAGKNISATGVYEGIVAVTARATGATMNLQPRTDGTPGIAIIGFADVTRINSGTADEPDRSGDGLMEIFVVLILSGGAFWLYKTGRIKLMLQKFRQ